MNLPCQGRHRAPKLKLSDYRLHLPLPLAVRGGESTSSQDRDTGHWEDLAHVGALPPHNCLELPGSGNLRPASKAVTRERWHFI